MAKRLKIIGRHHAEVWEDGNRIDRAHGRESVWKMRVRHGLDKITAPKSETKHQDPPTGFETNEGEV